MKAKRNTYLAYGMQIEMKSQAQTCAWIPARYEIETWKGNGQNMQGAKVCFHFTLPYKLLHRREDKEKYQNSRRLVEVAKINSKHECP